ncbi:hypothetical protein C1N91_10420 [Curtobacterium sp. SGAir0471]|uniref:hypothetical protein n=1 Tax=Curtobacterium sp. SGAir0471 TaxID=2070337 RepID=UPI0010CD0A7D|nr:hypothetical protein [Curtobacterium sp. SGAir0471]QCR43887.1 hypothetical protein C1N91_10420 [Curtobacterium sp. SGAir0471]
MKKVIAAFASVLAVASVLVGVQLSGVGAPDADRASALSGSQFEPGNIIPDAEFYNGGGMNEAQVQTFLDAQIGTCRSSSCLNVGRYSLNSHGADAMCGSLTGGSSLTAAQIITRVGAACGINPKVIIVTLQKEQALINGATARNPSAAVLERAMGYACPDSANGGCDPAYAGVGNQVFWASWQWKRYGNPAGTSNYFTWFAPGGNRNVQYNPNAACGTKSVYIQNKATAALYYYTPYTPNQAALANLYGTGDGCSAYGNRNFWRLYNDWFGVAAVNNSPVGNAESVSGGVGTVDVGGWAFSKTTTASIQVHVYIDGVGTAVQANRDRPDVAKAYPGRGAAHGFSAKINASDGAHRVCVYAVDNVNPSTELVCKSVTVQSASPFGSLDAVQASPNGYRVAGWAIDPQTTAPIAVQVAVDGKVTTLTADRQRPDVAAGFPASGAAHGFDATVPAAAGGHQVCVTAKNVQTGVDTKFDCRTVQSAGNAAIGSLDQVSTSGRTISVSGWAIDGSTTASTDVHVYINGSGRRIVADLARSDIARAYPAYGAAHGFSGSVSVANGTYDVCVYAISPNGNKTLGCRSVTVSNPLPIGSFDSAMGVSGGVRVTGWAIDKDTTAPIVVAVYVDGAGYPIRANTNRSDIARAYPAYGAAHGFDSTVPASSGKHSVCAYAIDSAGGDNAVLGCKAVTVP